MIKLSVLVILLASSQLVFAESELIIKDNEEIAQLALDILVEQRAGLDISQLELASISTYERFGESATKSTTRIDVLFRVPSSKNFHCSELTESEKNQLPKEALDKLDGKICSNEFATYRVEFQASHPKNTASIDERNLHLLK